jgi:hypothetical protein
VIEVLRFGETAFLYVGCSEFGMCYGLPSMYI